MVNSKLDDLVGRMVSIRYMDGKSIPFSILVRINDMDRHYIYCKDILTERLSNTVEQTILKHKYVIFLSVIKEDKEEDMIDAYLQVQSTDKPKFTDLAVC